MPDMKMDSTDRVTQAMRVLEIQERLERGSSSSTGSEEPLTEPEVAILKQMCNVSNKYFMTHTVISLFENLLKCDIAKDFTFS